MKIAWKAAVGFASLVLVSCGGGGGNAAVSKTFNYGAPQAPSTSEQAAASSAKTSVTASSGFGSSPDASKATAIVSLADDLAATALGGVVLANMPQDPRVRRALSTAATVPECTTATANSVTFNNCTQTESGFTFTLNGSVSATADSVTWNITGGFSGSDQGISFNVNIHQSGTLTVTSTTVKGSALSEIAGSVSGNGQNVSFGVSTAALVDLTYNATCVTSGSIEVKRVWSPRPNGATGPEFADVGVKLTWTGCDTVQVQHSI